MTKTRKVLLAICFILWIQFMLVVGITKVDGNSMAQTLYDDNDYVYVDKNATTINRFDIVIINSSALNENIVKRVIGLPGEHVAMKDGVLFVDGVETAQPFDYIPDKSNFDITLDDDEYFVMGDNRDNSVDSRIIGPINEDELEYVLLKR